MNTTGAIKTVKFTPRRSAFQREAIVKELARVYAKFSPKVVLTPKMVRREPRDDFTITRTGRGRLVRVSVTFDF